MDPLAHPGASVTAETLLRLGDLVRRSDADRRRTASTAGAASLRRLGQGLEPQEVRLWSEGDEIRRLDRNATARRGSPHVRLFRDEREPRHLLIADFRPSMFFGTRRAFRSVAAAEALTLLGWRLARGGARVDALALGPHPSSIRGGLGDSGMRAVAAGLAEAHERALRSHDRGDPPLDALLTSGLAAMPRIAGATLATAGEALGPDIGSVLQQLGRRGDVGLIVVTDPFTDAPPRGLYAYDAGGGSARLARVGAGPARAPEAAAFLEGLGLPVVSVATADEPAAVLAKMEALGRGRLR